MAEQAKSKELKSTGYELFILLLSMVSIVNVAIVFVTAFVIIDPDVLTVVAIIDALLTIFFLFDFCYRYFTADSKSGFFFKRWGCASFGCFGSRAPGA